MKKFLGLLGASWGAIGTIALLGYAIWRLSVYAVEVTQYELDLLQWAALIANILFMAYSEGYKGFQKGYSPRVAARCLHIAKSPSVSNVLLAPLFVMGYFNTTRKRLIVTYSLTVMIIGFIIALKYVSQPWKGIVDVGVVVGLAWGVVTLLYFMVLAITSPKFDASPELSTSQA